MRVAGLETPALLVDLDIMQRNLDRVADYTRANGLRLRPHTKTHKTPELARMQLDRGAAGLAVAKVGEAEVMQESGTPDILVAYPILGASKLQRLMAVARNARVTVALDSLHVARGISEAARAAQVEIGLLAEVDVGLNRVGVSPGDELVRLLEALRRLPHCQTLGIQFYPGHIRELDELGLAAFEQLRALMPRLIECCHDAGIPDPIVSAGSTPTLFHSHKLPGLNEIRPGTYIFNDRNTVLSGACQKPDCAAYILTTVVSNSRSGHMIIDGGSKTFSSDRLASGSEQTFGEILEAPAARFHKMNEEHGFVDLRPSGIEFAVGDRVRVVPNHICVAVNLHERIYGIRGDSVEHVWTVKARGKLQ